jgi:outer membrane protein assembly factor BamD
MKKTKFLIFIILSLLIFSCSKKNEQVVTEIKGENLEQQMIQSYNAGLLALEDGDTLYAAKKFNEVELLFPQSIWASRASLMSAYAYWLDGYYSNSISEIKRFLEVYPNNDNTDYAYYLLSMNYYDSIVDEKKDLRSLNQSKKYFKILIKNYPDTDYALDAKYKLDLIDDTLAAKELYIARHYMNKKKWIAAVNRLKNVIENYNSTIYIEEALHRIVEIYYLIGLEEEAKKYALILGYNYGSGDWYKQSYKVFNKDYEVIKKIRNNKKDKKDLLLSKLKSLF